jgi:LysM repeat protein
MLRANVTALCFLILFQTSLTSAAVYVVASGDSLSTISLKIYGSGNKWKSLARLNNVRSPYGLTVGQHLRYPATAIASENGKKLLVKFWDRKLSERAGGEDETTETASGAPAPGISRQVASEAIEASSDESRRIFHQGRAFFDDGNFSQALTLFRTSRHADEKFLPPWFYEIRALRKLGQNGLANETRLSLLSSHPELASLPILQDTDKNP